MNRKFKIRNFEEFINESEMSKTLTRFYMLVKNPFPLDSDKVLGKLIGEARNALFDQVTVNKNNYTDLKFTSDVPVLNFTEDNDLVEKMLKSKVIEKSSLYNMPTDSQLVSDKVSFALLFGFMSTFS